MQRRRSCARTLKLGAPLSTAAVALLALLAGQSIDQNALAGAQSSNYLADVAQFSRAFGRFIDLMLDKVNLLAELVVEMSLDEQCALQCGAATTTTVAADAAPQEAAVARLGEQLAAKLEASREFKDARALLSQVNLGKRVSQLDEAPHCKLLNLNVEARELPVPEMAQCCGAVRACYATCGASKLACDLTFQHCLTSACNSTQAQSAVRKRRALFDSDDDAEPKVSDGELDDDESAPTSAAPSTTHSTPEADEELDSVAERRRRETARKQSPPDLEPSPALAGKEEARAKLRACRLAGKVLQIGNLAFGCQQFKLQQDASKCCESRAPAAATTAAVVAASA